MVTTRGVTEVSVADVAKNLYFSRKKARNFITITIIKKFFINKIVNKNIFYKSYFTIFLSEVVLKKLQKLEIAE